MFKFLKTSSSTPSTPNTPATPEKKPGIFGRLKHGLAKTRASFTQGITNLFLGKKVLDADLFTQIENLLISADVGYDTTLKIMGTLTQKLERKELNDGEAVLQALQTELKRILAPCDIPLRIPENTKPYVILVVGINGSGKTTSIGKLAHYFKQQQKQVMLAAGDTFRAAAIEQLHIWSERNEIPIVQQQPGADPAAVIFDALEAAKARHIDVLLADTAGRLHTQTNLMSELKKIKRVLAKLDSEAPHEVLIVLDATLGQNALNQVKQFNQDLGVTGIALTKLDGTAKGGIIFALADQMQIPIRFIGIGEAIDDLKPFNADEFVEALFLNDYSSEIKKID